MEVGAGWAGEQVREEEKYFLDRIVNAHILSRCFEWRYGVF